MRLLILISKSLLKMYETLDNIVNDCKIDERNDNGSTGATIGEKTSFSVET